MLYHPPLNETHSQKPLEILLIEDNKGDIRLIEEALKESGFFVNLEVISDGNEVLNYLNKVQPYSLAKNPDIILMDLNIPKKDGKQLLKEIKKHPSFHPIPIIILTVSQAESDIIQCYNLSANCYIVKPFEIDRLMQVIKSIVYFWSNIVTLCPKKENIHG